jgi:hypothetical protein
MGTFLVLNFTEKYLVLVSKLKSGETALSFSQGRVFLHVMLPGAKGESEADVKLYFFYFQCISFFFAVLGSCNLPSTFHISLKVLL